MAILQIALIFFLPLFLGIFYKSLSQVDYAGDRLFATLPRLIQDLIALVPGAGLLTFVLYYPVGLPIELAAFLGIAALTIIFRGGLTVGPTVEYRLIRRIISLVRDRTRAV